MNDSCPDCGVAIGVPHEDGCDVARCLATGGQLLMCGGELHQFKGNFYGEHLGECGDDIWTGEWPGVEACRRLGLWCYEDTSSGGIRFVPCGPEHPEAREDLNRLMIEARWDREQQRWVARI